MFETLLTGVRQRWSAILVGLLAVGTVMGSAAIAPYLQIASNSNLDEVEQDIRERYTDVSHLPPRAVLDSLAANQAARSPIVLDVREPSEYQVSHLPGARQIAPNASESDILAALGDVKDRTIVLYCSVGVRSSIMAKRVQDALKARGAKAVVNMSGGIFRWHNERKPLQRGSRPTDAVHPYDALWGRYVSRQHKVQYSPSPDL